jgi:hypothetical protein
MRRLTAVLVATVTALAIAATAQAGCWATVGIEPLPTGIAAGEMWAVDVEVRQHGRTPMTDATPAVVITSSEGAERRFPAQPTGEAGLYRAEVAFPAQGTWSVAVYDGFPVVECAQTHSFGGFAIGPDTGPSDPGPSQSTAAAPSAAPASPAEQGRSLWPVWLAAGLGGAAALLALAYAVRTIGGRARPRSLRDPRPAP